MTAPDSTSPRQNPTDPRVWVALGLMLIPTFVRAMVVYTPLPFWDADPLLSPPTGTRLAPSGALLFDSITLLGVALGAWTSGTRSIRAVTLLLIGTVPVLIHGAGETEHLLTAGPWVSGLGVMLGVAWLGRDAAVRRVVLGLGLGFVALLLMRSLVQLFVEHAETVRTFRENKDSVLGAQGWMPGSSQARLFERRLEQPDVRAWFGTSNMLATFAGACGVYATIRMALEPDRMRRLAWLALASAGVWLLLLTGSKGGIGASLLGLAGAGVWLAMGRGARPSAWRVWIPAGACVLVLLGVALRGALGERLGELSLLFRAHYLQASLRILADHPLLGTGPSGFQEAYLLAKNPLNPEEVSSPHSLPFDWLATLGVCSLAWLVLVLRRGVEVAGATHEETASNPEPSTGEAQRAVVLIPVLAFAGSAFFERDLLVPVDVLARVVGVVGWVLVARFLLTDAPSRAGRGACVGLVVVLLGHAMIEMTPIQHGSAGVWFLLLGACGTGFAPAQPDPVRSRAISSGLLAALACWVAWVNVSTVLPWERALRDASVPLARAGELMRAPNALPATDMIPLARAEAIPHLVRAHEARPGHLRTRLLISRVAIDQALAGVEPVDEWIETGRDWASRDDPDARSARAWRRLAAIESGAVSQDLVPLEEGGARAIESLERAFALDPYNPRIALELARWHDELVHIGPSAEWAARALELDAWRRLDPLRRFDEATRRRLERFAARDNG